MNTSILASADLLRKLHDFGRDLLNKMFFVVVDSLLDAFDDLLALNLEM